MNPMTTPYSMFLDTVNRTLVLRESLLFPGCRFRPPTLLSDQGITTLIEPWWLKV